FTLDVNGKVHAAQGFNGTCGPNTANPVVCNQDVAEAFAAAEATEPGDLVVLVPREHADPTVRRSSRPGDGPRVGVVSTSPGLVFDQGQTYLAGDNAHLITHEKTVVAVVGRVPVKISTERGSIAVGDPLAASSTPGAAMKATRAGQIVGYALEPA